MKAMQGRIPVPQKLGAHVEELTHTRTGRGPGNAYALLIAPAAALAASGVGCDLVTDTCEGPRDAARSSDPAAKGLATQLVAFVLGKGEEVVISSAGHLAGCSQVPTDGMRDTGRRSGSVLADDADIVGSSDVEVAGMRCSQVPTDGNRATGLLAADSDKPKATLWIFTPPKAEGPW